MNREIRTDRPALPCIKIDGWGKLLYNRELSSVLCDDLEGWDGRRGDTCTYNRFTSLYNRNQQDIVKQLYSN